MTRPDWCPEDVWFKAQSTIGFDSGCECDHCCQTWGLIEPVARAILAERERCAKLAEEQWLGAPLYPDGVDIARAIRGH